jgi:intermediate cleaving peptidase 55
MILDNRHSSPLFTLFVREKNKREELWEGARSGTIAARDVFNADEALDVANISSSLESILEGADNVYTDLPSSFQPKTSFEKYFAGFGHSSTNRNGIVGTLSSLKDNGTRVKSASDVIAKLRLIKSPSEVKAMRFAGKVAGRTHTHVMGKRWHDEGGIRVALMSRMMESRCENEAYVPVVASGKVSLYATLGSITNTCRTL